MTAAHGVNVTRVLLTGMHAGAKVASEVDSPAWTGLRRACGGYLIHDVSDDDRDPHRPPPDPLGGGAGDRGGGLWQVRVPLNLNGLYQP